tara:strand:- start:4100 stop:5242 length:1143 start_codon:yes stop_codon:yes gene_type:complete
MRIKIEKTIKTLLSFKTQEGFTVIELVAVISILSILSAVSIPSVNKWVKLSRIDSAKALVNSTAAECLQSLRIGNVAAETTPSDITISDDALNPLGYKIQSASTKCDKFFIEPTSDQEKILYSMGFRLDENGKITKIGIPAINQSSLNSCKLWAGSNCGITAEQQAEWDRLAAIEAQKKACNDSFYTWLRDTPPNGGSGGPKYRWNSTNNTCSLETWAFEGTIQADEDGFKAARNAKLGRICAEKLKDKESSNFDGIFTDSECGINTYFFEGTDLGTADKTFYDAKVEEKRRKVCLAAEGAWKQAGQNGKFEKAGCEAKWMCNQTIYVTLQSFNDTTCGFDGPQTCLTPPHGMCKLETYSNFSMCRDYWQTCKDFIDDLP